MMSAVFFVYVGSVLPRMNTGLFSSPDETAVSVFADAWTPNGGFRIPVSNESGFSEVAQLHPRSMVRQGDWLVPVGFLGMPFLVMIANRVSSDAGAYLTLILVLSSAIPLFFLLRKKANPFIAWTAVIIYLSFPTVLLYVNRGFFPNLPVVACSLWAVWLLHSAVRFFEEGKKREWFACACFGGLCCGTALFIRPIEGLWLIPWMVWALWPMIRARAIWKKGIKTVVLVIICLAVIGGIGLWLSMKTYPFNESILHQPISGYQLSDYVPRQDRDLEPSNATRDIETLLPFAFHPRTIWQNIKIFLFNGQGIWVGASMVGALLIWIREKRSSISVLALSGWTLLVLFLMYGQTVYADNITGSATIGNSFLRYLLPLVPLIAIGCAYSVDALRRVSVRGYILSLILLFFLSGYGTAYALNGDAESVLSTRRELARYTQIRKMTAMQIPSDSIIISERSDKIFASGPWTVVSPIPSNEALNAIRNADVPMYLFHRTIHTYEDIPKAISNVFMNIGSPIISLDNEALYPLYASTEDIE
jgi:hypothetical protein